MAYIATYMTCMAYITTHMTYMAYIFSIIYHTYITYITFHTLRTLPTSHYVMLYYINYIHYITLHYMHNHHHPMQAMACAATCTRAYLFSRSVCSQLCPRCLRPRRSFPSLFDHGRVVYVLGCRPKFGCRPISR